MDWFLNLRKIALVGLITGVLPLPYGLWEILQPQINQGMANSGVWWIAIPLDAVALYILALPLVFLWFLHQNRAHLDVPPYARLVAKAAGLTLLILEIREGVNLAHSFHLNPAHVSAALGLGLNISLILILAALARGGEPQDPSASYPSVGFRKVTRVALITGYAVLGFQCFRIAYIPGIIWSVRSVGRTPPKVMDLLADMLTALWLTACLASIPFIVSRSLVQPEHD